MEDGRRAALGSSSASERSSDDEACVAPASNCIAEPGYFISLSLSLSGCSHSRASCQCEGPVKAIGNGYTPHR